MDFVEDQNPVSLYKAQEIIGLPDYVQTRPLITKDELALYKESAFADPDKREYPIFEKAAAWLSCVHFAGIQGGDRHVAERLIKAAEYYGFKDDILTFRAAMAGNTKQASTDERRYALSVDFGSEKGVQTFYPLDDFGAVLGAQRALIKDADDHRIPIEYFKIASEEIIKAASDYQVPLNEIHDRVVCAGIKRLPNFERAAEMVEYRKEAGCDEAAMEIYRDLVKAASTEWMACDKYVNLMLDMDYQQGIQYNRHQPDPYQVFYGGMKEADFQKLASESVVIKDVVVPMTEFQGLQESTIRQRFNKTAAEIILTIQKEASDMPEFATQFLNESLSDAQAKDLLKLML